MLKTSKKRRSIEKRKNLNELPDLVLAQILLSSKNPMDLCQTNTMMKNRCATLINEYPEVKAYINNISIIKLFLLENGMVPYKPYVMFDYDLWIEDIYEAIIKLKQTNVLLDLNSLEVREIIGSILFPAASDVIDGDQYADLQDYAIEKVFPEFKKLYKKIKV